jgi:transcriptional regulator EpsA
MSDDPIIAHMAARVSFCDYERVVCRLIACRSDAGLDVLLCIEFLNYLSPDAMISASGDSRIGKIHFDVFSVEQSTWIGSVDAGALSPFLTLLFQSWLSCGRFPSVLEASGLADKWELSALPERTRLAISNAASVLIHGSQDQRGRNDCIYAFFAAKPSSAENGLEGAAVLVPFLDFCLRQISIPLPETAVAPPTKGSMLGADASEQANNLSERELGIMRWVAGRKSNAEIGNILNLSSFTVKNLMQRIFKKLDVFNRAQAVAVFCPNLESNA